MHDPVFMHPRATACVQSSFCRAVACSGDNRVKTCTAGGVCGCAVINDNLTDAIELDMSSGKADFLFNNSNATIEAGELDMYWGADAYSYILPLPTSIWYRFTPATDTIDVLVGTGYLDWYVVLYTLGNGTLAGSSPNFEDLEAIAENDDGGAGPVGAGLLVEQVTPGQEYWIAIGGYAGITGADVGSVSERASTHPLKAWANALLEICKRTYRVSRYI